MHVHVLAQDSAAEGFKQRDILQLPSRFRLTSERELQNAFSDLTANHHIRISSHHPLILTETLIIDVDNITLTGRAHNGTTLACPPGSNGSAIVIKGADVHLENLKFQDCDGESAVVIEPSIGRRRQPMTVSFFHVQFLNNGMGRNQVNGPAIHVRPCAADKCRIPLVKMESCKFHNNHGKYGGAIYAEDADFRIKTCKFIENSAAMSGGAIYSMARGGNLIITGGVFENNTARWNKLPQQWRNTKERVPGTGGAITVVSPNRTEIQGVHFNKNVACIGGGALDLVFAEDGLPLDAQLDFKMSDTYFDENLAYCGREENLALMNLVSEVYYTGGAMLQAVDEHVMVNWTVTSSTFRLNRARYGGAMHLAGASVFPLSLSSSHFSQNSALRGGGAIDVRGAALRISSTIFHQNKALWGGAVIAWFTGSLFTHPDPNAPGRVTVMEENTAVYGGAIQFAVGGVLELTSLTIRNNTGFRYGGGINCFAAHNHARFSGITLENNRAFVGGGIAFYTTVAIEFSSFEGQKTVIANNTASVGGGVYYDSVHYLPLNISMADTLFTKNRAADRRDAEIEKLLAEAEHFEPYDGAPIIDPFQFADYYEEQTIADILSMVPGGQGGGLCMTLANIQFFTVVEVIMERIVIEDNEAVVGGGASIHFSDLYWDKGNETHCSRATVGAGTCQRFFFSHVTIKKNKALFAGGLFTTHPRNILLTCNVQEPDLDASFERMFTKQITSLPSSLDREEDLKCMVISENEITDGASIEAIDAGTSVHALTIVGLRDGDLKTVASGENLAIPCPDPDQMTCDDEDVLVVSVRDAFDHVIARGIDDAQLELTLLSDSVMGDIRYTATNGSAVINNTQAHGIGIRSSITIECESDRRVHVSANFSTRECYPGEYVGDGVCHVCQADVYGFLPHEGKCEKCEEHAICKGGASLIPMDNFWHSSPFSRQFHQCLHPDACNYPNRTEVLAEFYQDSPRLQEELWRMIDYVKHGSGTRPDFADYEQCAPGYEGILCGSCRNGYGRSFRGSCEQCPAKQSKTRSMLFLTVFLTFLMVGINCLITLLSTRARIQLVHREERERKINRPRLERTEVHIQRRNTVYAQDHASKHIGLVGENSVNSEIQSKLVLIQQLVAAVQLTETLKIFVNYLQVTSAAMRLPVEWKSILNSFLSVEAGLLGVTNEALSVPFECNFSETHRLPPSILAVWTRILTPLVVLVFLIAIYTIIWIAVHPQHHNSSGNSTRRSLSTQLITGVIVITVVTVYFSYIDLMRELLRMINCVPVDSEVVKNDHPYQEYSIFTGEKVWAEDTSLVCFRGDHRPTGIAGYIGLILALLVIVFIIAWQRLNKENETNTEFVARYWFIYQAYRKEWYTRPWEAVILARKIVIAAVVVYSFQLGPSLQASTCVGVLLFAHTLQVVLRPFKVDVNHQYVPEYAGAFLKTIHAPGQATKWIEINNSLSLNALESVSLLSSILVFYSAIILADSKSSYAGQNAMCVFAFCVNLGFLFYMLYRLYCGLHVLIDLKLEMSNPSFMVRGDNHLGFLHLLKKIKEVLRVTLRDRFGEREQRREIEVV